MLELGISSQMHKLEQLAMRLNFSATIVVVVLLQGGCGGSSGDGTTSSVSTTSIAGTVPGTVIEAFADDGAYHAVESRHDGSALHPFELKIKPGVGVRLVMITNQGTADEVVTPIAFRDSSGKIRTRLVLKKGERVDLGYVPLPMGHNAASADDRDGNGVLDEPMVLDDVGAENPLRQSDVDDDGIDDWNDPDHGGYHYDGDTPDPLDHDGDGVPNSYDIDHVAGLDDSDGDGMSNHEDANRNNEPGDNSDDPSRDCDAEATDGSCGSGSSEPPPQDPTPAPAPTSTDVDLDIVSFTATEDPSSTVERRVYVLELAIRNNGDVDEPRDAIIVARTVLGKSRVLGERYEISAPPGPTDPTVYEYVLEILDPSGGGLDWAAYIDDDDTDYDIARVRTLFTY